MQIFMLWSQFEAATLFLALTKPIIKKDMVIHNALDDLGGPQGSYPESFSLLYLWSLKL